MWKLPLAYGRAVVTKSWRLDMLDGAQSPESKLAILDVWPQRSERPFGMRRSSGRRGPAEKPVDFFLLGLCVGLTQCNQFTRVGGFKQQVTDQGVALALE